MKKITAIIALGIALLVIPRVPAFADASQNGCEHSGGKAAGCSDDDKKKDATKVPEPTSFALLAVGLVTLGGTALVFGRKRQLQN